MTTNTKILIGVVVLLGAGVYLFRIRAASADDELARLRAVLAGHLIDPYPDPGGSVGIVVCRADGTGCVAGDGGHT